MNEYLPLLTLLRLLAVLALVLAPHAVRLPGWEIAFIAALLAWRGLAAVRQWRPPPTWLRVVLALLALAGVQLSFGRIAGQVAGTALLCVMVALKVIELRARRDVMVLVFMMYFVLMTQFLESQELWTVVYLLGCAVAITAVLADCNHPAAPLPWRTSLRRGGAMVGQSLPIMVVLFILFPRISGPLWGLPTDAGAARTGLSDRMAPGDISSLVESDAVAFRVSFDGPAPPSAQRYWRGPVFDHFDGRGWERSFAPARFRSVDIGPVGETRYRYTITLEPHRLAWLFALEQPLTAVLPGRTYVSSEGELLNDKPVTDRIAYALTSSPRYVMQPTLNAGQRLRNLQLPEGFNPKTRALAQEWVDQGLAPAEISRRALDMLRQQNFVYTLKPPDLGRHSVDDFLFDTRRGFCEHYSSSYTFLMRAAGIPARVVTGYQGGEYNDLGGYYVVSQSDAHAWSEIWLDGLGWRRIDPTSAVAPSRVERGLGSAISASEGLPGFLSTRTNLKLYFTMRWDWVNARWNALVLAYGPQLQSEFLSRFGIGDAGSMIMMLTIISTLMLGVVGALLARQFAPVRSSDVALLLWQRAGRQLRRAGLVQRADEGPRDFVSRARAARPELATALGELLGAYLQLRYLGEPDPGAERRMLLAVRRLRRLPPAET